jgi:hypothetical protein
MGWSGINMIRIEVAFGYTLRERTENAVTGFLDAWRRPGKDGSGL